MGIEGFLTRIKDAGLGTRREIGCAGTEEHTKAIIDGPSLAHFIYNTLSVGERYDSAIAPPITYRAIASATIDWLDRMRTFGFLIEAILFDGALPETKRDTRLKRLANYTQKLSAYHVTHVQYSRNAQGQVAGTHWNRLPIHKARKEKPPPAFLVAAVAEELANSHYAHVMLAVPDEADRFCVAAAREACFSDADVMIFTNDSDLIIFDSGAKTSVVLFNDLVVNHTDLGKGAVMSGVEFRPGEIIQKYQLEGLLRVAYDMKMDRFVTFTEAVRSKTSSAKRRRDFTEFAQEYQLDSQPAEYRKLQGDERLRKIANGLDVRLSELVQQVVAGAGTLQPNSSMDMYLPFLLEAPDRASAWRVGTDWRATAYKALLVALGHSSVTVKEFRRQGSRVVGMEVASPDSLDANGGLLRARLWMDSALVIHGPVTALERWRILTMELALQNIEGQDAACSISLEDVVLVLTGQPTADWNVLHLLARYQAMYYSMRMFQQVVRYVQAMVCSPTKTEPKTEVSLGFNGWENAVTTMPGIADFFEPVPDAPKASDTTKMTALFHDSSTLARLSPVRAKREKVKMSTVERELCEDMLEDDSSEEEGQNVSLASNPFAALAR